MEGGTVKLTPVNIVCIALFAIGVILVVYSYIQDWRRRIGRKK